MKTQIIVLTFLTVFAVRMPAQFSGEGKPVAGQETREFAMTSIRLDGEVQSPVEVDLRRLPLRTVSIKEFALDSVGNGQFKGAFSYSGYALYDILNSVKFAKKNEAEFKPPIDLYVVVGNDKGEEAVFSWGELSYAKDNFRVLISKTVKAINPSKLNANWTLPGEPRLVCAGDLNNSRFIGTPTRITVRSCIRSFATGKKESIFSPTITLTSGKDSMTIVEINPSIQPRKFRFVGFGHGMGYKGESTIEGFPLQEVTASKIKLTNDDFKRSIVVVSSKDGYRGVFSASEIWNRNDLDDILLIDRKDSQSDGRYTLFVPPDFYVDRNIKAVERIEIMRSE